MKRLRSFITSLIPILFLYTEPMAEIAGSDDLAFKNAVDQWLNDDDMRSLPALSKLANQGNKAARYLLAQIEQTTGFASETKFMKSLNRGNRLALLRAPGGLSGTSWLEVLQNKNEELADILLNFNDPHFDFDDLNRLINSGESRLADYETFRILDYGRYYRLKELDLSGNLQKGEQYFLWFRILYDPNVTAEEKKTYLKAMHKDLAKSGIDSALFLSHVYRHLTPKTDFTDKIHKFGWILRGSAKFAFKTDGFPRDKLLEFSKWVQIQAKDSEQLTLPYITCKTFCPADAGMCITGSLVLSRGYREIARYRSPLENIISYEDYITSKRALNSFLRRMKWQVEIRNYKAPLKLSTCLKETLKTASFNY